MQVIGVQPAASDVMRQSVLAGRIVDAPSSDTLSDATAGESIQGESVQGLRSVLLNPELDGMPLAFRGGGGAGGIVYHKEGMMQLCIYTGPYWFCRPLLRSMQTIVAAFGGVIWQG